MYLVQGGEWKVGSDGWLSFVGNLLKNNHMYVYAVNSHIEDLSFPTFQLD
jgi:hypothetical protein